MFSLDVYKRQAYGNEQCIFVNERISVSEFRSHINFYRYLYKFFYDIFAYKAGVICRTTGNDVYLSEFFYIFSCKSDTFKGYLS